MSVRTTPVLVHGFYIGRTMWFSLVPSGLKLQTSRCGHLALRGHSNPHSCSQGALSTVAREKINRKIRWGRLETKKKRFLFSFLCYVIFLSPEASGDGACVRGA